MKDDFGLGALLERLFSEQDSSTGVIIFKRPRKWDGAGVDCCAYSYISYDD